MGVDNSLTYVIAYIFTYVSTTTTTTTTIYNATTVPILLLLLLTYLLTYLVTYLLTCSNICCYYYYHQHYYSTTSAVLLFHINISLLIRAKFQSLGNDTLGRLEKGTVNILLELNAENQNPIIVVGLPCETKKCKLYVNNFLTNYFSSSISKNVMKLDRISCSTNDVIYPLLVLNVIYST